MIQSLTPTPDFPLVIEASGRDDLVSWVRARAGTLEEQCGLHGAILLRGFTLEPVTGLEAVASTFAPLVTDNGEHPPIAAGAAIATPVPYAAERKLLWHHENSFNHHWPRFIWFACATPAARGGETPIVDSRRVFERIDPHVRRQFIDKRVTYVRNYGRGYGLPWQEVFRTNDAREVEAKCRREHLDAVWKADGVLETRATRPAVVRTVTGAFSWFNQAQHWHPSCLPADIRATVRTLFDAGDLPRNCYFGDGTAIDDGTMEHILGIYESLEVVFKWQSNDVLMLDNMSVAHARNAYSGHRRHFVAMGGLRSYDESAISTTVSAAVVS